MFDSKKPINYHLSFSNEIGAGSKVLGNLEGKGNFRVAGHFVGNISEVKDSASTLVIDKEGLLTGDLHYSNLIVAGTIEGSITVDEKMEVYPTAVIRGDIRYKTLDIHPDAKVNGLLSCVDLDKTSSKDSEILPFDTKKKAS
ncbi:polymer-forming cytoskeletal protein [Polynucleobacter sp. MG-6-Vaara-E2]|jgi:cytoskeletal protein CcmA (bactofilin family)|uniref:bactofilin family protein n=1 Tax=Polynucleobacter sp. MG-6-Vaara-E2 TaxID=2576932 RepID=UPI001BFDFD7E|nr:polymer-forming cytoskeletal protein [Polynucleobacter sp. MG-6-Vaara-E2]QWD97250.1 polymer-forming cytoskeletal protein [Polynucleobacter sp. MG-6-Vaara-E2]